MTALRRTLFLPSGLVLLFLAATPASAQATFGPQQVITTAANGADSVFAADLVAVRGDPIQNIRLLEDVGFVMKGGEVHPDHLTDGEQHLTPLVLRDTHLDTRPITTTHSDVQAGADQGSLGESILFGSALGAVGFAAGGLAALAIARDCTSWDFCRLEAAFYGAAAGGTSGMALGVHLGNRRQGNVALDFLTGAAVWGAGIAIVSASDDGTVLLVTFVAIPIIQLASTVAVERAIGRYRSRSRDIAVSIVPHRDGRFALALSVAF